MTYASQSSKNDRCPYCHEPVGKGYVTAMVSGGFRRLHEGCKQRLIAEARKRHARGEKRT